MSLSDSGSRVLPVVMVFALLCASATSHADLSDSVNTNAEFTSRHESANAAADAGNYEVAVPIWRELAEAGFARSQHNLGNAYYFGRVVEQDNKLALEWYQRAAKQGLALSQLRLCEIYAQGEIVSKDYRTAFSWCLKAGEQNVIEAQRFLGFMYRDGDGVEQDLEIANTWFRKAAKQGDSSAQLQLGLSYLNGLGVDKDAAKALRWNLKAAESGYARAQSQVGSQYFSGLGIRKNEKKAVEWWKLAAKQGDVNAQWALGHLYFHGSGGSEPDYEKAVKWLSLAVQQGDERAENSLGIMYEAGLGVSRNPQKAVELFVSAAKKGNPNSQFILGHMYLTGQYVGLDVEKAVYFLQLANDHGQKLAAKELREAKQRLGAQRAARAAREENAQRPVQYLKDNFPEAVALAEAAAQLTINSTGVVCPRYGITSGSELLWAPFTRTPEAAQQDVKSAWDYVGCIGNIIGLHNAALEIIDLDAAKEAGFTYYPPQVVEMVKQSCGGPWALPEAEKNREGFFDGALAENTLGACVSAQVQAIDHIVQYWKH